VIPKKSGKLRKLGMSTVADRVVQAALKLVHEPIFEADFQPCSYGFRPNRRAHDAISEIQYFATHVYTWVLEADIRACFDEIGHVALMDRLRARIKDKRVCALVKAFLKAGVMTADGERKESYTARLRAGYSPRCWPTSRCPHWMTTSPGNGRRRWEPNTSGRNAGRTARARGGLPAMPTYAEGGISRLMPRPGLCRPACWMARLAGGVSFCQRHNPVVLAGL
jgi:hypothetical protein